MRAKRYPGTPRPDAGTGGRPLQIARLLWSQKVLRKSPERTAEILYIRTRSGGTSDQLIDISDRDAARAIVARRLVEPRIHERPRRLRRQDAIPARSRIGGIAIEAVDTAADAVSIIAWGPPVQPRREQRFR